MQAKAVAPTFRHSILQNRSIKTYQKESHTSQGLGLTGTLTTHHDSPVASPFGVSSTRDNQAWRLRISSASCSSASGVSPMSIRGLMIVEIAPSNSPSSSSLGLMMKASESLSDIFVSQCTKYFLTKFILILIFVFFVVHFCLQVKVWIGLDIREISNYSNGENETHLQSSPF